MTSAHDKSKDPFQGKLRELPAPGKLLATWILVAMLFGMVGAIGQIFVHDIVPNFLLKEEPASPKADIAPVETTKDPDQNTRGDLFADLVPQKKKEKNYYENEQFVWALKWTHIHLFGMNMIFIFTGGVALFLDLGSTKRSILIVTPFVGVFIDILSVWLKTYVSPQFFWLHLLGGGLFSVVFICVFIKAISEMWFDKQGVAESG